MVHSLIAHQGMMAELDADAGARVRSAQALWVPTLLDTDLARARIAGTLDRAIRNPELLRLLRDAASEDRALREAEKKAHKTGAVSAARRGADRGAHVSAEDRAWSGAAALICRAQAHYSGPRVPSADALVAHVMGRGAEAGWATDYLLEEDYAQQKVFLLTVRLSTESRWCPECRAVHPVLEIWCVTPLPSKNASLSLLLQQLAHVAATRLGGAIELHACYDNAQLKMAERMGMRYTGVYGEYTLCTRVQRSPGNKQPKKRKRVDKESIE